MCSRGSGVGLGAVFKGLALEESTSESLRKVTQHPFNSMVLPTMVK